MVADALVTARLNCCSTLLVVPTPMLPVAGEVDVIATVGLSMVWVLAAGTGLVPVLVADTPQLILENGVVPMLIVWPEVADVGISAVT